MLPSRAPPRSDGRGTDRGRRFRPPGRTRDRDGRSSMAPALEGLHPLPRLRARRVHAAAERGMDQAVTDLEQRRALLTAAGFALVDMKDKPAPPAVQIV